MLQPQPENNRIRWLMAFDRADEREACYFGLRGGGKAYPLAAPSWPAPTPFPTTAALGRHIYALGDAALRSFWSSARGAAAVTAVVVFYPADWE